jgi:hypothetical protein
MLSLFEVHVHIFYLLLTRLIVGSLASGWNGRHISHTLVIFIIVIREKAIYSDVILSILLTYSTVIFFFYLKVNTKRQLYIKTVWHLSTFGFSPFVATIIVFEQYEISPSVFIYITETRLQWPVYPEHRFKFEKDIRIQKQNNSIKRKTERCLEKIHMTLVFYLCHVWRG